MELASVANNRTERLDEFPFIAQNVLGKKAITERVLRGISELAI